MLKVLVFLVFFIATNAWGQVAAPHVSAAQLDAAVDRVTDSLAEGDPQRAALLKSYADTRAALEKFEQYSQQMKSFSLARANAVAEAEAIENKVLREQSAPPADDTIPLSLTLAELVQMIQVNRTELDARTSQRADIKAAIDAMPRRPEEIRERLAELAPIAAELESQLGLLDANHPGNSSEEAAEWLADAELASVNVQKAALEEELLSQPMRLRLLKAQLDQASYEIAKLEKKAQAMILRAGELRQGEAARAQAAADQALIAAQDKHELVRQLADRNVELSRTFSVRNQEIQGASHQEAETRSSSERLESDLIAIERKIELLGMSSVVGAILRERQAQLPAPSEIAREVAANEDNIRASSLRQVELEDERRHLRSQAEYVSELLAGVEPEIAAEIRGDIDALVDNRLELIRTAVDLENTYAHSLGDLDFSLRRYTRAVDQYRQFISERLFWIPSREQFSLFRGYGAEFFEQVGEVLVLDRWLTVLKRLPAEMLSQPLTGLVLLLVLLLIYYGPQLKRQLAETGKQVGYVRSDHFFNTLHALALTVLLSLKWPLLMLTMAWLFEMQVDESELATALYAAAWRGSLYFWGLEFLRIALLPRGLVDMHFRWPGSRVAQIRTHIVNLEWAFLPAAFFVVFFLTLYPREVGGPLGTLAVILVLFSLAVFFRRLPESIDSKVQMIFRDEKDGESRFWGKLIHKLLFWIPALAIVAVFFGYTYTAIEIALLLIRTFVLISCIFILHQLGLRWLGLARRRMAFSVRQEHARSSGEEGEASVEAEILEHDPELLTDEGTRLLNLLTMLGVFFGAFWIWAEVFPALGILDSVQLWHQTVVVEGQEVQDPVTVTELLTAAALAVVGWIVLQRIPGLLEIFLRQKIKVAPASAYAFTRVFQYSITLLLVVIVLGSLGVSWSSLQWAVAALSLGIGFGLQEIVANFISGLIILFEQPIRLGDTVTVGEVSGTVTRIQMRATTIRDFDRRELLVPNKEFITGQLLNWSLSDSVTRRLIQVGVAYGTDMDRALEIVRQAAKSHPQVLADPESMITFDEFGDNSLLISLRYFIEQLDQRLKVDSELRLDINRRFKEEGIVVAFPQRDIHIDSAEPFQVQMVHGTAQSPAGESGLS